MTKYIEREAAIERLEKLFQLHACTARAIVEAIPTADVRPVVLCRDCIHYKPQQKSALWSSTTPMCSRSATIKMPPDGFCSFGIKRGGD